MFLHTSVPLFFLHLLLHSKCSFVTWLHTVFSYVSRWLVMHTRAWAVKLYLKKIFVCVIDSKMFLGQLSKYLHACLITMRILFFLSVDISGAVQGNEVTWDYRLGANEITGSVAMQRDSGSELGTVCPFSLPGGLLKCQVCLYDNLCETIDWTIAEWISCLHWVYGSL